MLLCWSDTLTIQKQKSPQEARRRPGRPKTPPELSPHYERQSMSFPRQAWKNLKKLADRGNARARSGPNYGKKSLRSWLYRFAMEDVPHILALLDENNIRFSGWDSIHLTVDFERSKRDTP